jgi:uncharacterized protein YbjT (DUF2867 family)
MYLRDLDSVPEKEFKIMKFTIAGVSGNTGKVAAESLLAGGHSLRVVVRNASKGAAWTARGAEVVVADLTDSGALAKALAGVDGAYLLVPPNMASPDPRASQGEVVQALGRAVQASEVPHVVFLSSVGAQHKDGTGPISGLYPAEHVLSSFPKTSLTAIRAGYFLENLMGSFGALAQGIVPSFFPKDLRFDMIATQDIGELAAKLLIEGATHKKAIVELGSSHSMQEVADALSLHLGKAIKVAEAPLEAMAATLTGFGFTPALAELYREMTGAIIQGRVSFEGTHRRVQGTRSLKTWLASVLPNAA